MTEQRIRFRDLKHYDIVDSLDELQGPAHGTITLPITVYWSGISNTIDLHAPNQLRQAYSSLLTNGRPEDLM